MSVSAWYRIRVILNYSLIAYSPLGKLPRCHHWNQRSHRGFRPATVSTLAAARATKSWPPHRRSVESRKPESILCLGYPTRLRRPRWKGNTEVAISGSSTISFSLIRRRTLSIPLPSTLEAPPPIFLGIIANESIRTGQAVEVDSILRLL